MNFLSQLIPENLIDAFGWMIIHSLWQGMLVALLLSIVLLALNKKSARIRYIVSVGTMFFFCAISIRTFAEYYQTAEPVKENITRQEVTVVENAEPTLNETSMEVVDEAGLLNTIGHEFKSYYNSNLPFIVTLYLLGVLFLTLKLTGGFLYSQRIKNYRTKSVDGEFLKIVNRLSERLQLKQKVKLVESALVKVPVTLGYFKPVILFPIGALTGLSSDQVEIIIAHELAHIKRADYLINLIQSMVEVVFFYHPAVWWISSIIRDERENVCDDLALEASNRPTELARALVFLSQYENNNSSFAMSAMGNKNKLVRRIKRMMGENKHKTVKSRVYAASLMLLVMMAFGAIACSTANGQSYHSDKSNLVYVEKPDGDARYLNTDRMNEDVRTYIFYKRYRGDKPKWEVTVDDNKIVDLYRNGSPVPTNDYYKYEDMLLDEIEDIDWRLVEVKENLADLEDELRDLKVEIDDDFKEEMKSLAADLKTEFSSHEFKGQMRELKRELSKLNKHNFRFQFDSEDFADAMRELKEGLQDIDFDIDVEWDSDEFRSSMRELSRDLADIKVDIDLSDLHVNMQELKEELKDLNIDMSGLKKEMKILGDFLDELKDEMISDGVIDEEDDLRRLEFEEDALYVNNRKVSHEQYLKYKEIYKKYYDEYPDENSFRIHDGDRW